jgi:purine-binding chemotaxis protein CheW
MPRHVRGVINLRGAVVPVLDLASRFGRPPAGIGRRTCIVIVEVAIADERQVIGLLVDAVNEVLDIPADQIEPAPAFGAHISADFIAGMGKVAGTFVIILRVEHLLSGLAAAPAPAFGAEPAQEALPA